MAKKKKSTASKKSASGKITLAKNVKVKRGVEEKLSKKPGGSSTGRYKTISSSNFAGKSGGTSPYSFPIHDLAHARNALARAHFAPNPEGIRKAVYKKYPALKKRKLTRIKGKKAENA